MNLSKRSRQGARLALAAPEPGQTDKFQLKREAILDSAARLFNQHGVMGTTLAQVASSVGLLAHSLGYYYRRKEDLAAACLMRSIQAVHEVAIAAASAASPHERCVAFLRGYAQLVSDMQAGRRDQLVNFDDIRALPEPLREPAFAAFNNYFRAVRDLLPKSPALNRPSRNARAHLLLSIGNTMRAWLAAYDPDDHPMVVERVVEVLIDGLATSPAMWSAQPGPAIGWPSAVSGEDAVPEAYLRAATALVNELGYRGASVDRIAASLSLTKGSFYHHHASKDDLIAACFERSFEHIRRTHALVAQRSISSWEKLSAISRSLVRFQLSEQGPLLRLTAFSALPESQRERFRHAQHRITRRLSFIIVQAMREGSIRPVDSLIASQVIQAGINSALELPRWVPGINRDTACELFLRPLFVGLLEADRPLG